MNSSSLLKSTIAHLQSDLARPAFARVYADARARHGALHPYASPAEVLSALRSTSSLSLAERDVVVSALVAECQRTNHRLWQALLLVAFEPMLTRIRMQIAQTRSDDFDQRVLVAFYGALTVVRPGRFLALALRRATQRLLFPSINVARREAKNESFDEETQSPELFSADVSTRAAEVIRIIEATGGTELREAMLATRGTDETLRAYVARTHPPKEQSAAYERLWRARNAVEQQLRAGFRSNPAPEAEPEAGAA
jgi:hypothetical protein